MWLVSRVVCQINMTNMRSRFRVSCINVFARQGKMADVKRRKNVVFLTWARVCSRCSAEANGALGRAGPRRARPAAPRRARVSGGSPRRPGPRAPPRGAGGVGGGARSSWRRTPARRCRRSPLVSARRSARPSPCYHHRSWFPITFTQNRAALFAHSDSDRCVIFPR